MLCLRPWCHFCFSYQTMNFNQIRRPSGRKQVTPASLCKHVFLSPSGKVHSLISHGSCVSCDVRAESRNPERIHLLRYDRNLVAASLRGDLLFCVNLNVKCCWIRTQLFIFCAFIQLKTHICILFVNVTHWAFKYHLNLQVFLKSLKFSVWVM